MAHGQLAVVAKKWRVICGEETSQPWGGKSIAMSTEFQCLKLQGKKRTCSSTISELRCPCPGWCLESLSMFPPDTALAHASAPSGASTEVQKGGGKGHDGFHVGGD